MDGCSRAFRWYAADAAVRNSKVKVLPRLRRLTLDFPRLESAFEVADLVNLVTTFPGLAELRLCPVVRFRSE
ncbi:hypothetical protein SCP_0402520 [Sparassis crispa]|uniref:F-box domain-containing protein n=1 Tax=Sparassis crispa TaxID=139825 RepID=A0A401GI94_9APHY|nr:hypothetical protein SCP_0402520 [Sparassis crispa]GBE81878.1 hypothetical protein SCP_0402520 [Sparassis crispa]